MNKELLRQKAVKFEGLSTRCSSCGFKNMMLGPWGSRCNLRKLNDDFIDYIEVIGNVADNPELVK